MSASSVARVQSAAGSLLPGHARSPGLAAVPSVRRARAIEATPQQLWAVVSDPRRLPGWWPEVERVEEAGPEAWTTVHRTRAGKAIRADFTRLEAEAPRTLAWRQEVEASPFERFLSAAETRISISSDEAAGATRVEIRAIRRLRGLARLGGPLVRRAARRQVDEALSGLERVTAR